MMSLLRPILPVAVLAAGALLPFRAAYGNIKYNKLEKRPCITCHTDVKGKTLNAVGKCYKDKLTMSGCEPKRSK